MMLTTALAESMALNMAWKAVIGLSPITSSAMEDTATATTKARTGAATA